jgi:EGF-like domain
MDLASLSFRSKRISLAFFFSVFAIAVGSGCFRGADISKIVCNDSKYCPSGYVCAVPSGQTQGRCERAWDASGSDRIASLDGALGPDGARALDGALRDLGQGGVDQASAGNWDGAASPLDRSASVDLSSEVSADGPKISQDLQTSPDSMDAFAGAAADLPLSTDGPVGGGDVANADAPLGSGGVVGAGGAVGTGGQGGTGGIGTGGTIANPCAGSPCKNGGSCTSSGTAYTCNCAGTGFTGSPCETNIDDCASAPCKNGAACVDGVNSYTCNCAGTGFTGTNCTTNIDDCASAPCKNGEICIDGINSYTCNCAGTGFTGTNCTTNIDDCASAPCKNGGICIDGINSYTCNCTGTGFTGTTCQTVVQHLYVADTNGPANILQYQLPITASSNPTTTPTSLPGIVSLAVDSAGDLFVGGLGTVSVFGAPFTSTSTPSATFPNGTETDTASLALTTSGQMFTASSGDAVVNRFDPPLTASSTPAQIITSGLSFAVGVAVDSNGTLYVSNGTGSTTSNVVVFTSPYTGTPISTPSHAARYRKLTVGNGQLFVADAGGVSTCTTCRSPQAARPPSRSPASHPRRPWRWMRSDGSTLEASPAAMS